MKNPIQFLDGGQRLGRDNPTPSFGRRYLIRLLAALGVAVFLAAPLAHATGTVTAWGDNSSGQTTVPAGLSNVVAVAAGALHSLALRADGTVTAWGYNGNGQTTVPAGLSNVVAVAVGAYHSLALRADGTVAAWGRNSEGQTSVPSGLSNVVAVAGGYYHSLALRADGTVAAWGYNYYGQTNVPAGLSNVVAVAGGEFHSLALRADGTVAAWGYNSYGQTTVPSGLSNVVAVAGGGSHSLALRADGTVAAWGRNSEGQTSVPAGLSNVVAVAGGYYHSLALSGSLAPILNRPLFAQTVVAGATVTFGMSATASRPYFFQWQMNGTNLPGATNTLLVLTNVTLNQAGSYSVVVSNSLGTVTSSNALLTMVPLIINTQPQGQTVFAGSTASLGVSCQSVLLPLTYQWRRQGANLPGATNNPLVLTNVTLSQAGRYSVVVSNSAGTVTSSNALLKVVPLVINTNPVSQTVLAGSTVSFDVSCQSVLPLAYQWRLTGTNLPGATGNPLVLSNVLMSQAGTYSVLVSNSAGTVTSSNALLTVVPLIINTQPQSQTVFAGSTVNFGVSCQSVLPLTYQWRLAGTNLPGATGNPLVLSNVVLSQAGTYSVLVSNSAGWAVSAKAVLTVIPLVLNTNPASQTVFVGSTVSFAVSCQSVLPLAYQWRLAGTNLPGATSNPLVLSNVDYSQAGTYSVIVSNSAGTATSSDALLTVMPLAAWGDNGYGQTTVPAGLSNVVTVAGGWYHSLALRADGTVAAWGRNSEGQTTVPAGLSNVVAVAGGMYHSLALRADGTVAAWGYNGYGQTTVPAGLSNVVAVAAGGYHSLALRADGTVVAWGSYYNGSAYVPMTVPAGLSNVVTVAGGYAHSLALRADGTVAAWGDNSYGQTNVPAGLSNVVTVAGGYAHSLALRADGTVVAWGYNGYGQTTVPAGLSNVVAVAGGMYHSLALRADGTVAAWGYNGYGQTAVPSWVTMVGGIASGANHSLAVPADGPPFITSRLASRVGPPGNKVFFRVEANGARPLHYQWQHNGVDLPGKTGAVLQLTSLVPGDAGDYSVIVSNGLGVATIPPATLWVVQTALQSALDCNLWLSVGGNSAWFAQTAETHDGVDAAQSGAITDNQESWLATSVVGPGTLTYWWKVSSEPDYDFLEFYLDGVLQPGAISGEVPWQQQTHDIPTGAHMLRWRYAKDVSDSAGQDAAWLDEVNFTPIPIPFQFVATDGNLSVEDGTFYLQLTAPNGATVVVESSFDLKTWTPSQTNTLPYGELDLEMPTGTNQQQFFRARIQ